jgi:hypothetical protein
MRYKEGGGGARRRRRRRKIYIKLTETVTE